MPFFLTGLFDDDYSTRVLVFALIEMVGEKYESEESLLPDPFSANAWTTSSYI